MSLLPLIAPHHVKVRCKSNDDEISHSDETASSSSISQPKNSTSCTADSQMPNSTETVQSANLQKLCEETETEPSAKKSGKKPGFTNKIRAMSGKTQRLFSRLYGSAQFKPNNSSESCDEFIIHQKTPKINSRRSLSYGTIPGIIEFGKTESKTQVLEEEDIEDGNESIKTLVCIMDGEDTDSGILVNESGASSFLETDDVFYDEPTSLPARLDDTLTAKKSEFKLIRLKLEEITTVEELGIVIQEIKHNFSGSSRFEIANIEADKLVDRCVFYYSFADFCINHF